MVGRRANLLSIYYLQMMEFSTQSGDRPGQLNELSFIDLSHPLNEKVSVYPGTIGPEFESIARVKEHGYAEMKVNMVLHSGTHIDAPCHILDGTKSIDQFPPEKFFGKAMVIDCSLQKEISKKWLSIFEEKIAQVKFILFYTGWQHRWGTDAYFENCPALTPEASRWLCHFPLDGIGFDAFSVDSIVAADTVTEETLPNHYILLRREILLIENLTNLDKLPGEIFYFQCMPLNISNGDGSPVRALAMPGSD